MSLPISLNKLSNLEQAQQMRECRNAVRQYMTHNQAEILEADQVQWFQETYLPAAEAGELIGYVVKDYEEEPIGYGLISKRDGRWWVSGGLITEARGKGYGQQLFEQMTETIHSDLRSEEAWLDVLNENFRARELYKKIGYMAVSSDERLTVMVHKQITGGDESGDF